MAASLEKGEAIMSSDADNGGTREDSRPSAGRGRQILFIHGMWHGAWCWDLFVDWFQHHGWLPRAIDLPGHGSRFTKARHLRFKSLEDYVSDLLSVISQFEKPPILVGHSMGCQLVELLLTRLKILPPAVVLMAPTRYVVYRRSVLDFALRHPFRFAELNLRLNMYPPVCTPELAREMLFTADMPKEEVKRLHAKLHDESFRVSLELMLGRGKQLRRYPGLPVKVIGAGLDRAIRRADVEAVAAFHTTKAVFFEDMPHDLMLAPGWDQVAAHIAEWLKQE
jgi:alpha-beta hydrolase superfamily lysophospholipase